MVAMGLAGCQTCGTATDTQVLLERYEQAVEKHAALEKRVAEKRAELDRALPGLIKALTDLLAEEQE